MQTKGIILIFCVLFAPLLKAQNLINNPSFEQTKKIPEEYTDFKYVNYWKAIENWYLYFHRKGGTSDYYRFDLSSRPSPKDGDAYIRLALADVEQKGLGVLQNTLKDTLKKGVEYYFEVYFLKPETRPDWVSSNFWIAAGEKPFKSERRSFYINLPKLFINDSLNYLGTDTAIWQKLSGIIKANGGEKYLLLGTLSDKAKIKGLINPRKHQFAYVYMDNVGLWEMYPAPSDSTKGFSLNNLFFDNGKSNLLANSINELEKLRIYLSYYSYLKIEISGHTDNVGNEADNLLLSKSRAEAVADYLTKNGISPSRLIAKGYGSTKPKASNNTKAGRQQNRRVEIIFIP